MLNSHLFIFCKQLALYYIYNTFWLLHIFLTNITTYKLIKHRYMIQYLYYLHKLLPHHKPTTVTALTVPLINTHTTICIKLLTDIVIYTHILVNITQFLLCLLHINISVSRKQIRTYMK